MIDNSLVRELLNRKQKSGRAHMFIIKKDNSKRQKFSLQDFSSKKHLQIQPRSRSQHRQSSQSKINNTNRSLERRVAYHTPPRNQKVRIRDLRTEKDNSRNKQKNVEVKKTTLTANKDHYKLPKTQVVRSYLSFIRADQEDQYVLRADFDSVRNKVRREGNFSDEISLMKTIIAIFDILFQEISSSELTKKTQFIQQNCNKYLQCQQKVKLQLLLSIYYPKLLHLKLRPYLVYQRKIIFFIYLMTKQSLLDRIGRIFMESVKLTVKYVREVLEILMEPITSQEAVNSINQTFRMLKAVGQMEKKLVIIEKQLNRIYRRSHKGLLDIELSMQQLLNNRIQWQLEKLAEVEMELSWKYFKIPPLPFIPLAPKKVKPYTLVIQLDQCIIYYDQATKMLKYRPYVDIFLTKLRQVFEIVLYTLSQHQYASIVVSQIQKVGRYFDYVLCESHLIFKNINWVKDFARLGRDPRRTVIIDINEPDDKRFLNNCIQVPKWKGNKGDRILYKLGNVLKDLYLNEVKDVREYLKSLHSKLDLIDEKEQQQAGQQPA